MKCSNCGFSNKGYVAYCKHCGVKLTASDNYVECSRCQKKNIINAVFCESCGNKLQAEQVASSKICVKCRTANKSEAVYCKKCGYSLTGRPVNKSRKMPAVRSNGSKMSKKIFLFVALTGGLLLALLATFGVLYQIGLFTPDQQASLAEKMSTSADEQSSSSKENISDLEQTDQAEEIITEEKTKTNNKNEEINNDSNDVQAGNGTTTLDSAIVNQEQPESTQKILVQSNNNSQADFTFYQWNNGIWNKRFNTTAYIGRNGVGTDYGEGKGITPAGTYKLGFYFGLQSTDSKLNYKNITNNSVWVDDVNSDYYNMLVDVDVLDSSTSHEDTYDIFANNRSYNYCIFIEHNGDGVTQGTSVSGKGSVITICGCNYELSATPGCVDIHASNMKLLLSLLDSSQKPIITIS